MKQFYLSKNNPTHFFIGKEGRVWDDHNKEYLPIKEKNRKKIVYFCKKVHYLHRLVATYFLDNPLGFTTISFKDGDSLNPKVDNLNWGFPPKDLVYKPIYLEGRESYFVLTEDGKVFNRNTGHYVKNRYYKGNTLTTQFNYNKRTYERSLYLLYEELYKVPREEAYDKFKKKDLIIPAPIIIEEPVRPIRVNGEGTIYTISKEGIVTNSLTQKVLKGSLNGGYIRMTLTVGRDRYSFALHRLVAEAFIQNPHNYQFVDHIDSDRLNNHVDNLRWVSRRMNNQAHLNRKRKISNYTIEPTQDERWKQYQRTPYMVSSCGRVKNTQTNRILKGHIDKKGYHSYNLTINGQLKGILGHRLVAELFLREVGKDEVVNHIDGNKANNFLSNLEIINQSENVLKAIYDTQSFSKWGRVGLYDKNKVLLKTYTTTKEASEDLDIPRGTIRSAITKKSLVRDKYYFEKIYS